MECIESRSSLDLPACCAEHTYIQTGIAGAWEVAYRTIKTRLLVNDSKQQ